MDQKDDANIDVRFLNTIDFCSNSLINATNIRAYCKHFRVDVNCTPNWATPRLCNAAADNRLLEVKILVEELKANVNITNYNGWTPLMFAADAGHKEMVDYLMSQGADPSKRSIGLSAADLAQMNNFPEIEAAVMVNPPPCAPPAPPLSDVPYAKNKSINEVCGIPQNSSSDFVSTTMTTESKATETTTWPETFYMSGLPLALHGWNNAFHKTNETWDDAPVYRMQPHSLYGVFPIVGVDLVRRRGIWQMYRHGDKPGSFVMIKTEPSYLPTGDWQYGGLVSVTKNCWTVEVKAAIAAAGLAAIAFGTLAWKRS